MTRFESWAAWPDSLLKSEGREVGPKRNRTFFRLATRFQTAISGGVLSRGRVGRRGDEVAVQADPIARIADVRRPQGCVLVVSRQMPVRWVSHFLRPNPKTPERLIVLALVPVTRFAQPIQFAMQSLNIRHFPMAGAR